MSVWRLLIFALLSIPWATADGTAGERQGSGGPQRLVQPPVREASLNAAPLDQVAAAVDGAESSHGNDMRMWHPDPSGPQGPMQVSEAAATDVGGGDRFDLAQNRAIGRAYLSQLFGRYRNWPDAIAAYNWGMGKMDAWVKAGRPPDKFLDGVALYLRRVLHESGLCGGFDPTFAQTPGSAVVPASLALAKAGGSRGAKGLRHPTEPSSDTLVSAACTAPVGSVGSSGFTIAATRFSKRLDAALVLAVQRAAQGR